MLRIKNKLAEQYKDRVDRRVEKKKKNQKENKQIKEFTEKTETLEKLSNEILSRIEKLEQKILEQD